MNLTPPPRRDTGEPVAPMINVVFLLLIFFLISATLAPPDPLDVTPPVSTARDPLKAPEPLMIAADGGIAWGDARGEDAIEALARRVAEAPDFGVSIKADASTDGATMIDALSRLRAAGIERAALVVESKP